LGGQETSGFGGQTLKGRKNIMSSDPKRNDLVEVYEVTPGRGRSGYANKDGALESCPLMPRFPW